MNSGRHATVSLFCFFLHIRQRFPFQQWSANKFAGGSEYAYNSTASCDCNSICYINTCSSIYSNVDYATTNNYCYRSSEKE